MERLTKRDKNGNAFYVEYGEYLGVHKLADYEDAEEQGRLLIMPCEIDSWLYAIIYDDSFHTYDVSEHPIVDFCFSGAIITDAHIGDPNCEIWTPEDQEEYHVCFSEEEAEKKAVELMQAKAKSAEMKAQEEEGELVRLPLKYGDRIYQVCGSGDKIIEWGTVQGFKLTPDSTYIYIGDGMSINAAHLGDTLFRTREEAEAKLEEMEDGQSR